MPTQFYLDLPFNAIKVSFLLQVLLMVLYNVMSIEYSDLTAISIKGCSDDDWGRCDFYLVLYIFFLSKIVLMIGSFVIVFFFSFYNSELFDRNFHQRLF